jgi:hypothetical protein
MQAGNSTRINLLTGGTTTDGNLALLQLRYIGDESIHTLTIDETGGTGSELLLTLTTGATATTIDGGVAAGDTLEKVVNQINAVDGWEARRAHGPADLDTGSALFAALAATAVSTEWTSALYRAQTSGAGVAGYMTARIASPNLGTFRGNGGGDPATAFGNNKGKIEILSVQGYVDGSTTVPYVKISQDQTNANGEVLVKVLPMSAVDVTTPEELYSATAGEGMVFHGPLLFEAVSDTASMPTDVDLTVVWRQVD